MVKEHTAELTPESGLAIYLKENNIDEKNALELVSSFTELYEQAKDWENKAKTLVITSSEQVEEMKEARTARLALVKVRNGIDKKRLELNESDKARIDARNGFAKWLKSLIEPTELYLEEQEKFGEREQQKKNEQIKAARVELLAPYGVETTFFDLVNMTEDVFQGLLNNSKLAHEAKLTKEKEAKELVIQQAKLNERITQIIAFGFYALTESNDHFKHDDGYEITLTHLTSEGWCDLLHEIKTQLEVNKKNREEKNRIEADRLAKENAKLQAEKDEALRKENAAKERHKIGNTRQLALMVIQVNMPFDEVADMTENDFADFLKIKNSEYQAEQNRIFVEKKKKEFEAAQELKAKQEKEAEQKRLEMAPDVEKLQDWVRNCRLQVTPSVGADAHKLACQIHDQFSKFTKWANEQIEKLNT